MKKIKKISKPLVFMLVVFVFLLSFVNVFGSFDVVYAADDDDSIQKNTTLTNSFVLKQYGEFQVKESDPKYYYIDAINEKDAKNALEGKENFLDKIVGFFNIKDNFNYMVDYIMNWVVNISFTFNRFMTMVMVICLEFAFSFDGVNKLIEKMNDKISGITGISNLQIHNGVGLFGSLIGIVVTIVAVYVLYVYLVKRAFIASAGALLKSILAIAIAILLFSNYSQFLVSANQLSNEVAGHVLGAGSQSGLDQKSGIEQAKNTLWKLFVDRPYMYLQYGTTDYNDITGGKKRVTNLMKYAQGDDRYKYVLENEVAKYKNTLMVANTSDDKLVFSMLYLITNGVLSIPVFGLAFVLILLNFWFLIIAAIAPFALIVGVIPIFSGVFKRYFIELMIPLGLKVFFSFFTLFILMMSDVMYNLQYNGVTGGIKQYVISVILQTILLLTLFVLRNRIKDIFSSGSKVIAGLRESTGTLTSPIKDTVQTTATITGTAIGAATGGLAGANLGAAIGNTAGKALTGSLNSNDVLQTANAASRYATNSKFKKNGGLQNLLNMSQQGTNQSSNTEKSAPSFNDGTSDQEPFDNLNTDSNDIKDTVDIEGFEDNQKVNSEPYNNVVDGATKEDLDNDVKERLSSLIDMEDNTADSVAQFAKDKNINPNIAQQISSALEQKGLNNVSYEEVEKQYNRLQSRYKDLGGLNNKELQNELVDGIIEKRNSLENNSIPSSPVQQFDVQTNNSTPNGSPVNTQPLNNTNTINQSPLNDVPIQNQPIVNNTPINHNEVNNSTLDNTPIDTQPINTTTTNSTPINNHSIDNAPINNNPLNNNPINNSTVNDTPIHNNPVDNHSIDSTPINSTPINSNSIDNQSVNSTPINSNPINNKSIDSTSLNNSSVNSTPINSPTNTSSSINTSNHNHSIDNQPKQPTQNTSSIEQYATTKTNLNESIHNPTPTYSGLDQFNHTDDTNK